MSTNQSTPKPIHGEDLTGMRFGRWLVNSWAGENNSGQRYLWLCRCDCGTERLVRGRALQAGRSRSCGCPDRWCGHVFGRLTVLHRVPGGTSPRWLCRCDCGVEKVFLLANMVRGTTTSCGCARTGPVKHGKVGTSEYTTWASMLQRCYDPGCSSYSRYGGRGITVCDRWRHDFQAFFDDMGPKPTPRHSLDRFPDNNGPYSPSNCRWATPREQSNNTRRNVVLEHAGERHNLSEWAAIKGISRYALFMRLKHGWTVAEALDTPLRPDCRRKSNP